MLHRDHQPKGQTASKLLPACMHGSGALGAYRETAQAAGWNANCCLISRMWTGLQGTRGAAGWIDNCMQGHWGQIVVMIIAICTVCATEDLWCVAERTALPMLRM
jgi:hypothetical protein